MKLFLFALLAPLSLYSQQFNSARLTRTVNGEAFGQAVVVNGSGGVYMKGSFSGGLEIAGNLYQVAQRDAFICKTNQSGNFAWFKNLGFDLAEDASLFPGSMTLDAASNIYVVGSFMGNDNIEGTDLINNGGFDVYVIKYDLNGNFQWATSFGGPDADYGLGIAVDAGQNVYVTGKVDVGNVNFGGSSIPTGGTGAGDAAFIAKIVNNGTHDWIRLISDGFEQNEGRDAAVNDADGFVYLAGRRAGLTNRVPFIRKYLLDGTFQNEVVPVTPVTRGNGYALAIDANKDVYLTGSFEDADLGFIGLTPSTWSSGGSDVFLAKFDKNLVPVWATVGSGDLDDQGLDVTPHAGDIYISGYYTSTDFTIDVRIFASGNERQAFVARFDVNGNFQAGEEIITSDGSQTNSVSYYSGYLHAAGSYLGTAVLGGDQLTVSSNSFFLTTHIDSDLGQNWAISSPKGEVTIKQIEVDAGDNTYLLGEFKGSVNFFGEACCPSEWISSSEYDRTDIFFAKVLADGSLDWITTGGGTDDDYANYLSIDDTGSLIAQINFQNTATVAGSPLTPAQTGDVLVKLEFDGSFVWATPFPVGAYVSEIGLDQANDLLYAVGYYMGSLTFPSIPALNSNGSTDMFVIQYNSDGSEVDAKTFGAEGDDGAYDVRVDNSGDIFITGFFESDVDFDTHPVSSSGDLDVFVAQLNSSLDALEAFSFGGTGLDSGLEISLNGSNLLIAGQFDGPVDFGSTTLDGGSNDWEFFVASIEYSGLVNWAHEIVPVNATTLFPTITELGVDGDGNVFVLGTLEESGGLSGDLSFEGEVLSHSGVSDAFVAVYDPAGELQYKEAFGSPFVEAPEGTNYAEKAWDIGVKSNNRLVFSGTLAVFSETFGLFTLQPHGSQINGYESGLDSYVVELDPFGMPGKIPKIYWTEEQGNQINRSNLDGTNVEQYYTGFSIFPQGLTIKQSTGRMYWTDTNGKVRKGVMGASQFSSYGDLINESTSGSRENLGVVIDETAAKIYWVSNWDGKIKSADLYAPNPISTMTTVIDFLWNPKGVAVDPAAGKIYYTENFDEGGGIDNIASVHVADLDGSNDVELHSFQGTGINFLFTDIKLDLANNKIYWSGGEENIGSPGEIFSADISDVAGTVTSFATLGEPGGIDLDRNAGKIYWVDKGVVSAEPPRIMKANLDGTNPETLVEGFPNLDKPKFLVLDLVPAVVTNPEIALYAGANNSGTPVTDGQTASINVGSSTQGTPIDQQFAIENTGTGTLSISSVGVSGTDFSVTVPPPATVAAGITVNFTVRLSAATAGVLNATITILTNDTDEGTFDFPVTGTINPSGCGNPSTANAGSDQVVCEGNIVSLSGSIGGGATLSTWSTSGTGTFNDTTNPTTTYSPGAPDISAGTVQLTLTTDDPDVTGPCVAASSSITITINGVPTASGGSDQIICEGSAVALAGTIGGSATSATWSSGGTGSFDNTSVLSAVYTPGAGDITTGSVMLALTTNDPDGSGPCAAATANLSIEIDHVATVSAGTDAVICPGFATNITGTTGGSASNNVWTTAGTGTFGAATSLATTYTASSADESSGSVMLTLTADAEGVCPQVSDQLMVSFSQPVTAGAVNGNANVQQLVNFNVIGSSSVNPGDIITVSILQNGAIGTATIKTDKTIDYTSNPGTIGPDIIQYQICNQCNLCDASTITVTINNSPPTFASPQSPIVTVPGESITVDLSGLIGDLNNNIDFNSLKVIATVSGVTATFNSSNNLVLDYTTTSFVGTDMITLEICDLAGACAQQILVVQIEGELIIYNGVSPNGDGANDYFKIMYLPPGSRVSVYNRWGDVVFESAEYDINDPTRRFEGLNTNGNTVTTGTYFYKVTTPDGQVRTGYLSLKR